MIYILGSAVAVLVLLNVVLAAYVLMLRIELEGAHDQIDDSVEHNAELRRKIAEKDRAHEAAIAMLVVEIDEADEIHEANVRALVWGPA